MRVDIVAAHVEQRCADLNFKQETWLIATARHLPQAIVTVNPDVFSSLIAPRYGLETVFDAIVTEALAVRAAHVLAIEVDPKLATGLARRFAAEPSVTVLQADALKVPLPVTPFRVMANVPFNATHAILRRLLDEPTSGLMRADLVVQWQVARAHANVSDGPPTDLIGATWGPWWHFERGRRLPAALFQPRPSVDAAVLTVTRWPVDLLSRSRLATYSAFLRRGYEFSRIEHLLAQTLTKREVGKVHHELNLPPAAAPQDLDLKQWVRLFLARADSPDNSRALARHRD